MNRKRWLAAAPLLALLGAAPAFAQDALTRMSVDSLGAEGDGGSGVDSAPSVTDDGLQVAFDSHATNLVAGDLNGVADVFVHDRTSGATVRVSVSSTGVEGNGDSLGPSLSSDGRFVAFYSDATNLIASDNNAKTDVFVHDRDPDGNGIFDEGNGKTTRVSLKQGGGEGGANSRSPSISGDGSLVAFASDAALDPNDANSTWDIYIRDRAAGTTTRVSLDSSGNEGNGRSDQPALAADGGFVAFQSAASNLVANDLNGKNDIFLRDLVNGTTTRVSVDSAGTEANNSSFGPPVITPDGDSVAFFSFADNLVASDGNFASDVFVHRRVGGTTLRVSIATTGEEGRGPSRRPAISDDGLLVAFESVANNLLPGDSNNVQDIFLHDIFTGTTSCITINCVDVLSDGESQLCALSADGQQVAFGSVATNLVANDGNGASDVILNDLTVPDVDASWANYGTGYPGRLGVPSITVNADPVIGTTISLDIGNSKGFWTVGFLLLGTSPASIPTNDGGTILVAYSDIFPLAIPPAGDSLPIEIPRDPAVCGFAAYLQTLEIDSGATYKLSFTPGLELICGH